MLKKFAAFFSIVLLLVLLTACKQEQTVTNNAGRDTENPTSTVTDQLGRQVEVPKNIQRIAALHHLGGHIAFALGQQDKMVVQSLAGKLGKAMISADDKFAAKSPLPTTSKVNLEEMSVLNPQVVFVYASFDTEQIQQLESAGMKVIAIRGETIAESFEAVKLMAKVLGCEERGTKYITACQKLLAMVQDRVGSIPMEKRPKVMFAGPKNVLTVATGDMLQASIAELAGGQNVAAELKGYWSDVSPEQVSTWNPDFIFLSSSLDLHDVDSIYNDYRFNTVKATQEKKVYVFPSNIGWWDFPAPHCVLGIVWTAKTLYPEKFADVDMTKVADEFYTEFLGYSFTSLGGKL